MDLFSRPFKSLTATALSLALVVLSPGILPYQVFAQSVSGLGVIQGQGQPIVGVPASVPGGLSNGFKLELGPSLITGASIRSIQSAPTVPAASVKSVAAAQAGGVSGVSAVPGVASSFEASTPRLGAQVKAHAPGSARAVSRQGAPSVAPGASAVAEPSESRGQRSAERMEAISRGVGATLEKSGPIAQAGMESAFRTGAEVESVLTGAHSGFGGAMEDFSQEASLGLLSPGKIAPGLERVLRPGGRYDVVIHLRAEELPVTEEDQLIYYLSRLEGVRYDYRPHSGLVRVRAIMGRDIRVVAGFPAVLYIEKTGFRRGQEAALSASGDFLDDAVQGPVLGLQSGMGWSRQLARPAGQEIADAVRSYNERVSAPAPQLSTVEPARAGRRSPLVPRLIASGLALLPAALLGVPLMAAGSLLAGGALVASSLALSVLPFMNERTVLAVRSLPGAALFSLGAITLGAGVLSGTGLWMGALVTLGGWGLWRYGRSESVKHSYEEAEALSAFFGALGAAAGAGLVLLSPAGWLAGALTWLAYPVSALLLMHLPSWVGNGIVAVFFSARQSVRGMGRVMFSLRNDTVLRDRLESFTKKHLSRSPWNAVWLAGVWIPVWLSDLGQFALTLAGGLAVSAMQAPVMFLWGVSHELAREAKVTRFLAAWAHFAFDNAQGSKKTVYNRIAAPLASAANSKNKLTSLPAGAAMRLAQWAWLAYAVVGTPVLLLAGFIRAFSKTGEAYEPKKHDPDYLRVSTDDKIGAEPAPEEPEDPSKPVKDPAAPKIIASAIALLPAYFIGLPLLASAGPVLGGIYLVSVAALAAMPFMPESTPKLVRQLPGFLLAGLGLTMFYLMPVIPFTLAGGLALLKTNAFWLAAVAALSGWGLVRYAGKAGKSDGRRYSVDDPEYIGAFFGALGVGTGVGIALSGLSGFLPMGLTALAYLTSPLLLMHLPHWIWAGAWKAVKGPGESARAFHDVLGFWHSETKFHANLKRHARYWLDKSVWNGAWLSLLWVPTWGVMAAEFVLSLGLGLAMGVLRAPFNFIAGAARELSPDSRLTKFLEGFAKGTFKRMEGNFDLFKRETAPLVPMMDESDPVSGRPTAKAFAVSAVLRLAQFAWLARMAFLWPAALLLALNDGYEASATATEKVDSVR